MAYFSLMSTAEASPELNPHGASPEEQGSNVPLGWKPSRAKPVPVVRCVQIKKDGNRCRAWSIRGYDKCYKHSGSGGLENVNKYAEAVIEAARLRLIDEADGAVDKLVSLMEPGTADQIRLKAATEVLDRAGIRGGFEIDVEMDVTESPAELIRKRLSELKSRADTADRIRAGQEDIVEGEVVEDHPTLFDLPDESEPEHDGS